MCVTVWLGADGMQLGMFRCAITVESALAWNTATALRERAAAPAPLHRPAEPARYASVVASHRPAYESSKGADEWTGRAAVRRSADLVVSLKSTRCMRPPGNQFVARRIADRAAADLTAEVFWRRSGWWPVPGSFGWSADAVVRDRAQTLAAAPEPPAGPTGESSVPRARSWSPPALTLMMFISPMEIDAFEQVRSCTRRRGPSGRRAGRAGELASVDGLDGRGSGRGAQIRQAAAGVRAGTGCWWLGGFALVQPVVEEEVMS